MLLCDLRAILFATLGYGKEQKAESEKAWYGLPSMVEYGIKPSTELVGVSRKIREREQQKRMKEKQQ